MARWHDDDRFWELFGPSMFTPEVIQAAKVNLERVVALSGTAPAAAVLDLACGVGRYAIEAAKAGYRATGVDRTRAYLQRARARAAEEHVDVEFVEADMREFERAGAFDLALNMYTSFGYFADPADDVRVAQNVFRSLRPGGAFVVEMVGKEVLARIFRPRDWSRLPDGALRLEEHRLLEGWSRIQNRWVLIRDGHAAEEFVFDHRLFAATELVALMEAAGFSARAFGGLDGTAYDEAAERLVVVARRPAV